jgi:hypothetical protein
VGMTTGLRVQARLLAPDVTIVACNLRLSVQNDSGILRVRGYEACRAR